MCKSKFLDFPNMKNYVHLQNIFGFTIEKVKNIGRLDPIIEKFGSVKKTFPVKLNKRLSIYPKIILFEGRKSLPFKVIKKQ